MCGIAPSVTANLCIFIRERHPSLHLPRMQFSIYDTETHFKCQVLLFNSLLPCCLVLTVVLQFHLVWNAIKAHVYPSLPKDATWWYLEMDFSVTYVFMVGDVLQRSSTHVLSNLFIWKAASRHISYQPSQLLLYKKSLKDKWVFNAGASPDLNRCSILVSLWFNESVPLVLWTRVAVWLWSLIISLLGLWRSSFSFVCFSSLLLLRLRPHLLTVAPHYAIVSNDSSFAHRHHVCLHKPKRNLDLYGETFLFWWWFF